MEKTHCQNRQKGVSTPTSIILPKMRHWAADIKVSSRLFIVTEIKVLILGNCLPDLDLATGERVFHSKL